MKRESVVLVAWVLLAAGCSSGRDDGESTSRAVAGQEEPGRSDQRPGPSDSVAARSDPVSTSSAGATEVPSAPRPLIVGEPAEAAAGGGDSNTARPGTASTGGTPVAAPQLPAYRTHDFYHWRWSPSSRSGVPWRFTASVPSTWRSPISQAAASWNAERRSLQYVRIGGDLLDYPPGGCRGQQLENNGVHRAALDGPDGIVATTLTCIDTSTAQAISVQIVLDAAERWSTGTSLPAPGEYDLHGAVAHEFGHATGWEGHYAAHDPRCTDIAHAERMCPALMPQSTAWRTIGPTDQAIFASAY